LAEITAIDSATAGRTSDEMLGLVLGPTAPSSPDEVPRGKIICPSLPPPRADAAGASGLLNSSRSWDRLER